MRKLAFTCLAILACTSCGTAATGDPPPATSSVKPVMQTQTTPALAGTRWKFISAAGNAVPAPVTATLRFDAHGHVSGRAGCNSYGARYTLAADGTFHVGAVMSTKMACLQPAGAMQAEHGVMTALQEVARLKRDGDTLELLDAAGKELATLQVQPSS